MADSALARGWHATRVWVTRRWPLVVAAAGVTLFAWPIAAQPFHEGIDPSWQFSLHRAFHLRTAFDDVVFTRGPLGFVNAPHLYFFDTWVLALAVNLLVAAGVAYALLRLLHLRLGLAWSIAIAAPLMLLFNTVVLANGGLLPEVALMLFALWACHRLASDAPALRLHNVIALGVVAVAIMLVKFNVGLAAMAAAVYVTLAVAIVRRDPRTAAVHVGVLAAIGVLGLPLLWMIVGQPISALPSWLGGTYEITRGYSDAMGIEIGPAWEYAAALLVLGVLAGAVATTRFARPTQRWLLVGLVAGVSFVLFKDGFVRHDAHSIQFFGFFAAIPFAFLPRWTAQRAFVLALAPVVAIVSVANVDVIALVAPRSRIESIVDTVDLARSSTNREAFVEDTRAELRRTYDLPPEILERVGDADIAVTPWELAVGNAYPELRWRDFPVIQLYNAYTGDLDRRNADFLAGAPRPRFILNEPGVSTDGRFARFESPKTALQRLCHYRVAYSGTRWQLLEETADRCGKPRKIGQRHVGPGERVTLPRPTDDSIVVARFDGIADGTFDSLRALFYKAPEVWLDVNGDSRYRFLPGHQRALHVLSGPECAAPQLDGGNWRHMKLTDRVGDASESHGLTFYRIPFSC